MKKKSIIDNNSIGSTSLGRSGLGGISPRLHLSLGLSSLGDISLSLYHK